MNFTWWVNRKDPDGRNLFQGGFLGLDNIGVFDRSAPLPGGGTLEQADGTAWMALYCQAMLQMALELTRHDPAYADVAAKFGMHFVWIAAAMSPPDGDALWYEEDGFYYDVMRLPDGSTQQLRVRSLVGLLPMCAATVIEPEALERVPGLLAKWEQFVEEYKDSIPALAQRPGPGVGGKRLVSLVGDRPAAADPGDHARRVGVPRPVRDSRDLALPRRPPVRVRHRRAGVPRGLRAGGVAAPGCSAGTRTGAGRCGFR